MSKNRRKAEEENRRRMDRHNHEKGVATKAANHQREVQLGRERLNGLHPVRMDSIADSLDEVDPKVRSSLRIVRVAIAAHRPDPFVAPQFQPSLVRENAMSESFVSSQVIKLKRVGTIDPKTGRQSGKHRIAGLKLPTDIQRRLIDRVDGLELEVVLNDQGILFRPATGQPSAVSLPAWVPTKK